MFITNKLRQFVVVICLTTFIHSAFATDTDYIKTQIQHWQTESGVPVYFVQTKELPTVDVAIAFDAGSRRDGTQFGIARFTANLLNEGTSKLNAEEIATQIDNLGILFNTTVDRDTAVIRMRSLVKPAILSKAIPLFTQLISDANFPEQGFNRTKMITLNGLQAQQQSPEKVGQINLYQAIYSDFPYGHAIAGTTDSINLLTVDEVKAFYKKYYARQNATLAIVGDVSLSQAKSLAEEIIKKLPTGQPAEKLSLPKQNPSKEIHVEFPADQTTILLGELGTNRQDPDYIPLYVGNHILGGGLTSRLFKTVRVKGGFSYSIYSHLDPLSYKGPFFIYLLTKATQTKDAIRLTKQTLENFLKEGPTPEEVNDAKKFISGNIPLNFASNDDILNHLLIIGFYQLPTNYYNLFINKINAAQADEIKRAFTQHVKMNNMIQVVVGQRKS